MSIVICVSIIAVVLTYFSSYSEYKKLNLFQFAFIIVTVLQAIAYDYGSDYKNYVEYHTLIGQCEIYELLYFHDIKSGAFKDFGWVVLNYIMPGECGFYLLVAVISLLRNAIYYVFIKKYVEIKHRWKAMAIYLFTPTLYLISFSAMRQSLAVSLCVLSFMFACKNRMIVSSIICICAGTVHSSAFMMFVLLLLVKLKMENGKFYAIFIGTITSILFFVTSLVKGIFSDYIIAYTVVAEKYGNYIVSMNDTIESLGVGYLLDSIMYIVILYFMYYRFGKLNHELKVFMILTTITLLVLPFQMNITGIISRITYYFIAFQIVVVPILYSKINSTVFRRSVEFIYIFMMFYHYYQFLFTTSWSADSYRDFNTIFSQIF